MLTSVFVLVNGIVFGSNSLIIQCLIAVWWIKRSKVLLLIYRLITDLFQEVELTDFKNLYCNVKYFKETKRLKNLQKAEAYLEPKQASMMKLFLWTYLTAHCFCNNSSIIDVRLGYMQAPENIEFFKG